MEPEKSRNGFYTVTFLNKNNLDEKGIINLFKPVGKVCKIIQIHQRVFVRFKNKEEVERVILKFGKSHNVKMAKNNEKFSDMQQSETASIENQSSNHKKNPLLPTPINCNLKSKMDTLSRGFHLILGNLPKSYTVKEVKGLVEEAKPLSINQLEETRVFHIKFCHIVLDSFESLSYLIKKLDGFLICSEKLIAVEAKHLLEWRGLGV